MSSKKEIKNIILPYKTKYQKGKDVDVVTSIRIERPSVDKYVDKSHFYLINKDQILTELSFIENRITIDSFDDGTEEIKFYDINDKKKLSLMVEQSLTSEHRKKFIKSII